ncbi:MADS-box protein SOC1-like isoform X2 [Papaver somniferum]|uniref:MADS-box protein SOC1-like isoform X2 n=1 Tax=Papaver somniferum TaxID=3469 RepID=UPI000E70435D|nr:MADS-box protein SOC1-like isoform X2 [Papaver somniferum]
MGRGKTVMRKIENTTSRQVTFSKRRNGLLKKASELSVLCDAEIALIVFSSTGKLYEFSSTTSMQKTIERYQKYNKEVQENSQQLKYEAANLAKEIENLQTSQRKLMGESLESCSVDELQTAETQLEMSLLNIRTKKNQLYREQIEQLKQQEEQLLEENEVLWEKCRSRQWEQQNQQTEMALPYETSPNSQEVETKLQIGRPERR